MKQVAPDDSKGGLNVANLILNLCVNVSSSGLTVSWSGRDGAKPPPGPYYYRVYRTQSDSPTAVQGTSVQLNFTGPVRIMVYDAMPGEAPPPGWYNLPTSIDSRMNVVLTGGG